MALRLIKLLDGIAEHRPRHLAGMLVEEGAQKIHADVLSHLPEHPPYRFLHKVVGSMEVELGIAQAPGGIALLRGRERSQKSLTPAS